MWKTNRFTHFNHPLCFFSVLISYHIILDVRVETVSFILNHLNVLEPFETICFALRHSAVKRFHLLLGTVWSNFAVKLEASVVLMNDLRANTVCIQVSRHFSIRVHFITGMLLTYKFQE